MEAEPVDVLVVGGGITGAGIARDAALRGFRTAVVDKGDFASGTSSHSSRLIHGGLRYLEQYEFHLVREASHERRVLLEVAPHLVRPLQFVLPSYRGARVPADLKRPSRRWAWADLPPCAPFPPAMTTRKQPAGRGTRNATVL